MMLACNYSPELMELLKRGAAPVDYIKAGAFGSYLPELAAMRALMPVLLHGMGSHERAGMPDYASLDFPRMNRLLGECGSPHLGIHLGVTNADAPGMAIDEIERRMAACAMHFMQRLDVPLLLENIGDSPEERTVFDMVPFVEPDRIGRLIRETGAGLLLDIAHAQVTAQYRGWDIHSYIEALPLDQVAEIHLSGTGIDAAGDPYDAHGPLGDADLALLEWALGRTRPHVVTLEYGYPLGFAGPDADACLLGANLIRMREILGRSRIFDAPPLRET